MYGQSYERQRRRDEVGQSKSRETDVETQIRDRDVEKGTLRHKLATET